MDLVHFLGLGSFCARFGLCRTHTFTRWFGCAFGLLLVYFARCRSHAHVPGLHSRALHCRLRAGLFGWLQLNTFTVGWFARLRLFGLICWLRLVVGWLYVGLVAVGCYVGCVCVTFTVFADCVGLHTFGSRWFILRWLFGYVGLRLRYVWLVGCLVTRVYVWLRLVTHVAG